MNRTYTRSGFSLIEVVFALALFSMASVVLTNTFVNTLLVREKGISNDAYNHDIQTVRMQLLLEPNRDDAENGSTYETLSSGTATWQAEIETTNVIDLFQVQLTIQFEEPHKEQEASYQETLYLLRPTWSEPGERSDLLQEKKNALLDQRNFDRF